MAKDNSFDVVSQVNLQEVDNAVDQTLREVRNRFDFKGVQVDVKREGETLVVTAQDVSREAAFLEVLKTKLVRREVPLTNMEWGEEPEVAPGGSTRRAVKIICGLDSETAKKISKHIRDLKIKVNAQIQGDLVRVAGKNRDDLQAVIADLRKQDFGRALQFVNYR